MKPASANELEFIRVVDKHGVTRKRWKVTCKKCLETKFIKTTKQKALSREYCLKCRASFGVSKEIRVKISKTLRNKYKTDPKFVEKVMRARNMKSGEEHWNWKGGATPLNQRSRSSEDSRTWKLAVLLRDKFKCRVCSSNEKLQAHHINSWSEFPEDRFIIENGLTLCYKCHTFYHKYEKEVRKNGQGY